MKAAGERTVYVKAAGDRAIGVETVRETAVGMKAVGERDITKYPYFHHIYLGFLAHPYLYHTYLDVQHIHTSIART